MINQPLTSGDHSKIVIFILLFLPSIFIGVGVIPAIFLVFGIFMMKKNEDFNHIETAVKIFRGYMLLLLLICVGLASNFGYLHITEGSTIWDKYDKAFYIFLLFTLIPILYLISITNLFDKPLNRHREWVEKNGIFSSKNKTSINKADLSDVNIIKGEKLKQYSVADELIKWAKLKEDGHISAEEFNQARDKLLK